MTTIHSTIPNTVLPTALTQPNKIVTRYESYTLIPRLGPLSYAYVSRAARQRLGYVGRMLMVLELVEVHQANWNEKPDLPLLTFTAVAISGRTYPEAQPRAITTDIRVPTREERLALGPQGVMDSIRRMPESAVEYSRGDSRDASHVGELRENLKADSERDILNVLREPNPVINRMVEIGILLDEEGGLRDDLIDLDPVGRLTVILDSTKPEGEQPAGFIREVSEQATSDALGADGPLGPLGDVVRADTGLKNKVVDTVADAIARGDLLLEMAGFDDSPIVDSREWAFLRRERVELLLKQPEFRGPLSVNSVAPNSELTITDSRTAESQVARVSALQSARRSGSNLLISNQIKEKLGTLHDFGSNLGQTMSEQGYEKDSSRGEKRSIVEQTLSEISEANASKTVSVSTTTASSTREYKTRGNDTDFATTEVSFEVFSPVEVTHYLDGIGAVWCPRIKNPFGVLRKAIREFEEQARSGYVTENHVIDPAEPLPTYEGFKAKSAKAPRISGDDISDGKRFVQEVTIRLSSQERAQRYLLDDSITQELEQDSSWYQNELDSDQYEFETAVVLEHVPASHIRIRITLFVNDEPAGANPNHVQVKVSVNKYKYTSTYLNQLKDYRKTVKALNPARRAAVQAQARRYARLKKEELIKRYANDPKELRDYTFITLMRQMFGNGDEWSYYHGVLKTCIDWERAQIQPEPALPESLAADGLSPFHFLNVTAVRFFLPIHKGSEDAFFEAVGNTLDSKWRQLFAKVQTYIKLQREKVETMTERMSDDDVKKLTLDEYESELVLGRHLEAVLSKTTFLES